MRAYRKRRREWSMLQGVKQRARKVGVPCTITPEDIVIPKRCPVLGIAFTDGNSWPDDRCATIDRINPRKGYVPGNIAVISNLANRIKNSANWRQIMKVGKWLKKVSRCRK